MADENKENNKRRFSALRTYKTDKSEYIKKENISAIDIAAKQVGAGIRLTDKTPPKRYVIPLTIILTLTFSLIGAAYFIIFRKSSEPPVPIGLPKSILIAEADKEVIMDLNIDTDQSEKIKEEIYFSDRVAPNKLINIQFITQDNDIKILLSTKEFFKAANLNPPSGFIESLDDKYMLAKFRNDEDLPVFIFKLKSFENTFAAMIAWERKNKIIGDFRKIFKINNVSPDTFFIDKELKNKDVRVLINSENNIIFGYSLINQKYLIISTSQEMLEEIFRRFSLPQYLNE